MGFLVWIDLTMFLLLFALFAYVFVSVTITNLHKVYLIFHFSMMLWPLCQFAIQITENPKFQLFYLKLAFVDTSLLAVGWLLFTMFLTGQTQFLRKKISLALLVPALLGALGVIINPNGMFVHPLHGGYFQREYGSLFWLIVTILIAYIIVSLHIMYRTLASDKAPRIKRQVKQVLNGILVMTAFIVLDIFLNVVLAPYLPVIPGLTSLGILLSALFFVIAIHRDKVFDIVTIAHQDIIDTLSHGILVLDDNEIVVEINQSLLPHIGLHIGDHFDMTAILSREESDRKIDLFLQAYHEHPLERIELQIILNEAEERQISIQAAPIIVSGAMVGRIITFQDLSELHRLIDEKNLQNEILQDRNQSLTVIQDELFQTNLKLEQLALTDSLTGCYNRHYLAQHLEHEVMKNMRYRIPYAIFLFDIDFFKSINDNYGHLVGDEVLCSTVEAIKQTLRRTDVFARYGGEEFIVYLPHTSQSQASLLAERVKSAVESNRVMVDNVIQSLSITISIGLLSINNFAIEHSKDSKTYLNELFEAVDKALYQAKKTGRNRIVRIAQ